jgi:hypothetical protein
MSKWLHPPFYPSGDARVGVSESDPDWEALIDLGDVLGLQVDATRDASPEFLERIADHVNATGTKISMELAGLREDQVETPGDATDVGIDSADLEMSWFAGLADAGHAPDYLRMDDPILRMRRKDFLNPPTYAGLDISIADAKAELVSYMQRVHATYPDVRIGMIVGLFNWGWQGDLNYTGPILTPTPDLDEWLPEVVDAINDAGERLWFLECDGPVDYFLKVRLEVEGGYTGYQEIDWWKRLREVRTLAKSLGLDFGPILNSQRGMLDAFGGSMAEFARDLQMYRARVGSMFPLDIVQFESWGEKPASIADTIKLCRCL